MNSFCGKTERGSTTEKSLLCGSTNSLHSTVFTYTLYVAHSSKRMPYVLHWVYSLHIDKACDWQRFYKLV